MLNTVLLLLAVFVAQRCYAIPMPIEGMMIFPSEDNRRTDHIIPGIRRIPVKKTVRFDDLANGRETTESLPVISVGSTMSFRPNSVPASESTQRRFQEHLRSTGRMPRDNVVIVFPDASSKDDLPDASKAPPTEGSGDNKNNGSGGGGGVVFPDLEHGLTSAPEDFLLSILRDNSTECDVDIGLIPINGTCERLLARSSCGDGEWLVYARGRFQCQERACPWGQVLFSDRCVNVSSFDVCPPGHILYVDLSGEASCDCQHGYVYGPASGHCYAQYTQGPCNYGHYVVVDSELGTVNCVPNPCRLDGWIHHEATNGCYFKLYEGFCDQRAMKINEGNHTVACQDVLPFNIFDTPRFNTCPPGSLRDYVQKCREYLPRMPVAATFPKGTFGQCLPGYTRDPRGTCKKVFSLFA